MVLRPETEKRGHNRPIILMPHQMKGGDFLMNSVTALLYWDQGTGKTFATTKGLELLQRKGALTKPILWVGPKVSLLHVKREIERYGGIMDHTVKVIRKGSDFTKPQAGEIIVMSYDLATRLAAQLTECSFSVIVLDELQYLKSIKAKRTKAFFGTRRRPGIAANADYLWALSGTPMPNNVGELYPFLHEAGYAPMSYWKYIERYCKLEQTKWAPRIVGNNSAQVKMLRRQIAPLYDRVRKKDVLKDLPDVRFAEVPVMGEKTARKKIAALEAEKTSEIDDLLRSIQGKGLPPSDSMSTLRRITELAKAGDCVELLEAELADRAIEKVVVFATHRDTITALANGLDAFGVRVIHGGVSDTQRQKAIDEFQEDENVRVFIGQTVAAGTAITLHSNGACQDVVFVSADWVPANNAQAVARVHRKGQTGNVVARFLHLENSTDEAVMRALARKTRMISEAFEEDKAHHAA